jgi:hypothetical protein
MAYGDFAALMNIALPSQDTIRLIESRSRRTEES